MSALQEIRQGLQRGNPYQQPSPGYYMLDSATGSLQLPSASKVASSRLTNVVQAESSDWRPEAMISAGEHGDLVHAASDHVNAAVIAGEDHVGVAESEARELDERAAGEVASYAAMVSWALSQGWQLVASEQPIMAWYPLPGLIGLDRLPHVIPPPALVPDSARLAPDGTPIPYRAVGGTTDSIWLLPDGWIFPDGTMAPRGSLVVLDIKTGVDLPHHRVQVQIYRDGVCLATGQPAFPAIYHPRADGFEPEHVEIGSQEGFYFVVQAKVTLMAFQSGSRYYAKRAESSKRDRAPQFPHVTEKQYGPGDFPPPISTEF